MSKKNKIRVHVTFRNSDDPLTCMLSEVYESVNEAKAAIKLDAASIIISILSVVSSSLLGGSIRKLKTIIKSQLKMELPAFGSTLSSRSEES